MAERETENHPGRDPEILERYTLARLTAVERSAIDAHFRECAECRQRLEEELRLAAGVRRMGRTHLKERLAGRLAAPRTPNVPWPRIAAIAATVLIVAGVGVIGFWLQERKPVASPQVSSTPGSEYAAKSARDNAEPPPKPGTEQGKKSHDVAAPIREKGPEGKDFAKAEEARGLPAGTNEPRARETTKESGAAIQAAAPAAEAERGALSEGYWTEGILSEEPMAEAGAVRRDGMEKSRAVTDDIRTNTVRIPAAKSVALEQQVVLTQQPSRMLQAQELGKRSHEKRKTIPTLARQVGDQLRLTLYPDTLFPANALQQATVLRRGEDSLTIQVGSQQIRYRFPSSLLQQKTAR